MKYWKRILLIGVFLVGCTPSEEEATDDGVGVEEVQSVAEAEAEIEVIDSEIFNGFWSNENFIYTIENETLYIMDRATEFVNSYDIVIDDLTENSMVLNLSDVREDHTTPFITTTDTVMQYDENESVTFMEQSFAPATEDVIPDDFKMFVTSEGLARYHTYQGEDLVIEDFMGYWSPRNKNYARFLDYNNDYQDTYQLFIDSKFMMSLSPYVGNISHIYDYTIEGNTLHFFEEIFDEYGIWEEAPPEYLSRTMHSRNFTLYQEEDGDRLVDNESGIVLSRTTTEDAVIAEYNNAFGAEAVEAGNTYLEYYENNGFPPATQADAKPLQANALRAPGHYPYSTTAALGATQLFEEAQIIAGNIPHPAGDINTDGVLNEFINAGEFSQTATLNRRPYDDVGYMFRAEEVFYGAGYVTGWRSGMKAYTIHSSSMDGYEIEVVMSDQDAPGEEFTEKYFWINENIMYKMDENGNYTDRYENIGYGYEDVWQFYHNLPDHQVYGED